MKRLKAVPANLDLQPFSQWLRGQNVQHRISMEGDSQVLWLADEQLETPVLNALDQYLNDPDLRARLQAEPPPQAVARGPWQARPAQAPLTFALILVAALLAWLTGFGAGGPVEWLVIVNPNEWSVATMGDRWSSLLGTLAGGQLWRLFTPDFLHFSGSHLVFNAVMLWFLGSQVEVRDGRGRLVLLAIVSSLGANLTQYLLSGPLFGGLSGVVYGVIAYTWLSQRDQPRFIFPPALMLFSVVWLLFGLTPLPEQLGIGSMANGAHLGGLLGGLALAAWLPPPKPGGNTG